MPPFLQEVLDLTRGLADSDFAVSVNCGILCQPPACPARLYLAETECQPHSADDARGVQGRRTEDSDLSAARNEGDDMSEVRQLTAVIEREGDGYVATCPELDIVDHGV